MAMDKPVIAGVSNWREQIRLEKSIKEAEDLWVRSKEEDDLVTSTVECGAPRHRSLKRSVLVFKH